MMQPTFDKALLAPKYWPTWFVIAFIFVLAWIPWPLQRRIGQQLGLLAWHLIPQRRSDTLVNIRLCFPELDAKQHELMARDVFRNAGISIFETANAWLRSPEWYRSRTHIEGLEHLKQAEADGKGVLLLGAHYSQLDLGGTICSLFFKVDIIYRPQNNPLIDYFVRRQRARIYNWQIDHDDMRRLFRSLKAGHTVWYTPDQDFGIKQSVFAPFFGITAATLSSTSRLASVNNSAVMFIHFCRDADNNNYMVLLTPSLKNYPSGDDVADATRINQELETLIRRAPTQYMWFHRRFKTRPVGEPQVYIKRTRDVRKEKREARMRS